MLKQLLLISALGLSLSVFGQNRNIDSLKKELQRSLPDTVRLRILNKLSAIFTAIDPDQKLSYARPALQLAQKLKDDRAAADAEIGIGTAYSIRGQLDTAMYWFKLGYEHSKRVGYLMGMGRALNNTGYTYDRLDNSRASLKYYLEALPIFRKLKSDKGINQTSINIGSIYYDLKQYRLAISYYTPCYQNYLAAGDKTGIAYTLQILANCYTELGDFKKAENYINQSLAIRQKQADSNGLAMVYKGLGVLRIAQGKAAQAIPLLQTSLKIVVTLKDRYEQAAILLDLTDAYLVTGQVAQAEKASLRALEHARAVNTSLGISQSLEKLVRIYKLKGNINKAFEYQTAYVAAKDSLEHRKALQDLTLLEYKRIWSDYAELQRDNGGLLARLKKYNNGFVLLTVILLAVILLLFLQYRRSGERTKANNLLQEQKTKIEHINQVKNQLFSIVSHDLRGPLANLQSLFGLYRAGALTGAELDELLSRLEENIIQTSAFLDNLLEWARSQLEGLQVHPQSLSLAQVLQKNVALVEERIQNKKLEVSVDAQQNVIAYADAHLVDLVVRNLLSNAIKFCRPGDCISLSTFKNNDKVGIRIADTGPGIDAAEQKRLFELDYAVTSGSNGEKGSHLGLVLCQDAVAKNNGRLWLESEPGKGTIFWVELPAGQPVQIT